MTHVASSNTIDSCPTGGRYLCGFLTPPVAGALLRAALVASCFRGAFPPVDFRAVCFVRAILSLELSCTSETSGEKLRIPNPSH